MIDEKKLINYIKAEINPYGKPFNDTAYEFGLKLIDYIEGMEKQPQVSGWIPASERLPSKEECEKYRRKFLVTVNAADPTTMEMKYVHTTVRGKEVERWEWKDSISPWDVKAWQPLPECWKGKRNG